jgi:sulfur dioxygenase
VIFSYAGNIEPADAHDRLESRDVRSLLIDVRTQAELAFVGFPMLSDMTRYHLIEWVRYPDMSGNTHFIEQCKTLLKQQPEQTQEVYLLCRSGQRSHNAGLALEQTQTNEESLHPITLFNVVGGFEGDLDPQAGQRSLRNGWKFAGLPWRQN